MAFFRDLGSATQIASGDYVRAVGWLADGHAFQSGHVAPDLAHRLVEFAALWGEAFARWTGPSRAAGTLASCVVESGRAGTLECPQGAFSMSVPR